MEPLPQFVFSPLGAVIAALIAALFSFVGLLISKENKISEFRQAWIDSLRGDISKYSASVALLTHAESIWTGGDNPEIKWHDYLKTIQPTFEVASAAQMSIRLRINPNDPDPVLKQLNSELLTKLDDVQGLIKSSMYDEAAKAASGLHVQAAPILKKEWERVKKGEPIYNAAKWFAGIFVLAALALSIYASVASISSANAVKQQRLTLSSNGRLPASRQPSLMSNDMSRRSLRGSWRSGQLAMIYSQVLGASAHSSVTQPSDADFTFLMYL